jgi:hypothetical protein
MNFVSMCFDLAALVQMCFFQQRCCSSLAPPVFLSTQLCFLWGDDGFKTGINYFSSEVQKLGTVLIVLKLKASSFAQVLARAVAFSWVETIPLKRSCVQNLESRFRDRSKLCLTPILLLYDF